MNWQKVTIYTKSGRDFEFYTCCAPAQVSAGEVWIAKNRYGTDIKVAVARDAVELVVMQAAQEPKL